MEPYPEYCPGEHSVQVMSSPWYEAVVAAVSAMHVYVTELTDPAYPAMHRTVHVSGASSSLTHESSRMPSW